MRKREKNEKKIETREIKMKQKLLSVAVHIRKKEIKRNRTIAYLDWLSWFPAKEGKK
jgi:hypothetical protein